MYDEIRGVQEAHEELRKAVNPANSFEMLCLNFDDGIVNWAN